MAETRIQDVIVPSTFDPYVIQRLPELSALWTSGIVQTVEGLNVFGAKGGSTHAMPFWNDLDGDDENLIEGTPLTVAKITSGQDVCVLYARGRAWGATDLAKALSGDDPMGAIGDLVAGWWNRRMQALLLKFLQGIFSAASMSGNQLDISGSAGGAANIDGASIMDAGQQLGDAKQGLTAMICHSMTETSLAKQGLIDYSLDQDARPTIPFYQGKRVIVDDGMPVNSGVYDTFLFGPGAIGWTDGGAPTPSETDRNSLAGMDILINRRHFVLHARGIKWIGTPSAGVGPTNDEAATGTNWQRVYSSKLIRIVRFRHKIG